MSELSQLRYHCRRGMRELDIVLNLYLDESYQDTCKTEKKAFKKAFRQLLQLEDPALYSLLLGYTETEDPIQETVLHKLRNQFPNDSPESQRLKESLQ